MQQEQQSKNGKMKGKKALTKAERDEQRDRAFEEQNAKQAKEAEEDPEFIAEREKMDREANEIIAYNMK